MPKVEKPHKGRITDAKRQYVGKKYVIWGFSDGHEEFHGRYFHTSQVLKHDEETGEIETRNSRYAVVNEIVEPEVT